MSDKAIRFGGSIPKNYDDYLGPFVFEPFAIDLAGRIDPGMSTDVLELACGTGRLTQHLFTHLSPGAKLTATDLNADMITVAKEMVPAAPITWETVDMQDIPYEDDRFDLIVSQFGIMLVPDRIRALHEIYRIVRPGGKLLFNVWGNIEDNGIWNIGSKVVGSLLGSDPLTEDPGPFSMQDENAVIHVMEKVGFRNITVDRVSNTGTIQQAAMAAKGLVQGLPLSMMIRKKDPALVQKIQDELEIQLIAALGDQPLRSPLYTLVFTAEK